MFSLLLHRLPRTNSNRCKKKKKKKSFVPQIITFLSLIVDKCCYIVCIFVVHSHSHSVTALTLMFAGFYDFFGFSLGGKKKTWKIVAFELTVKVDVLLKPSATR